MSQTVAEAIVSTLVDAGARRCYGIVGDTINQFTDVIRRSPLQWVSVRHEEVGAMAAGGEAYMTGELAVCAGTCGPGSLHFINGIFESNRNGAPVVLIASTVDRREEGLGFPQELDQKKLYSQCSVFCERVSHPQQAGRIVALAAQAALAERGVSVVVVNGDLFSEKTGDDTPWRTHRFQPRLLPGTAELDRLASMIEEAGDITLYAGLGARDARQQVVALAEKLKAPVVHTSKAKEFIEPDNPFNVGMTGILGNRAGMESVLRCDLLILLGCDFAYSQFYPEQANIVQIDNNPAHIGRRTAVDLGLVGHVDATLDSLLPRLNSRQHDRHLQGALKQWEQDRRDYESRAEVKDSQVIHPQYLTQVLDRCAAPDAIFTADGGSPMVWLLRHLRANGQRRFLTSLSHGTMANAYPQALGIAAAYPQRQVIAMCGDGGLSMLLGDLLTLVQEDIPVKLLVFNNGALGFVEMEQRTEGLLDAYTALQNPDFRQLAEVCGLRGFHVDDARELEGAVGRWLHSPGPALLDARVNRMELVMPPRIEAGQVLSTSLFGIKAVLDGRMKEVVALLKDNFLR